MKIVLIEDDEMLRKSLTFFLRGNNFEVEEIDNGADALQYIAENKNEIKLVITDLNLPFISGKQVVHTCKFENPNIKIIVLTSLSVETSELELFDLGADEFVAKPFSPNVLLRRIQKLFA